MHAGYRFDHRYREPIVLTDGTRAGLRLLSADDKELLRRGFDELSDDARYHRFFVRKRALLDSELRFLTELDQKDHVALVAVRATAAGEEGMGVARAVRLVLEPAVYEVAVTVVDRYQRRGLGRLLVERMRAAIEERGGRRVRFCVLPTNLAMQQLLRALAPAAAFSDEAGFLRLDLPLRSDDAADAPHGRLGRTG